MFKAPKVTNDEEYFQLLERITKGAELIESGKLKPSEKARYIQLYDALCEGVRQYRASGDGGDD